MKYPMIYRALKTLAVLVLLTANITSAPKRIVAAFSASESAGVFLSIGTSSLIEPAASLPVIAKQNDAILIEIN